MLMMKNFYIQILSLVLALFFSKTLSAQEDILVRGIVSDTASNPLAGVAIEIQGSSKAGTITGGEVDEVVVTAFGRKQLKKADDLRN